MMNKGNKILSSSRDTIRGKLLQLTGVRNQTKAMGANVALANSVAGAAKAMQGVNATMNAASMAKTLGEFKMATERMGMSEEMSKFSDSEEPFFVLLSGMFVLLLP